jgi:predicted transcriptional regulator
MPTIKVSDEIKQKLNQIGGQLASKNGKRRTYEETIEELIRAWLKK